MAESPTPKPKGLHCPSCGGYRLTVITTKKPCPGVKIRYRRCSACSTRLTTREVVIKVREAVTRKGK